MEKIDGISEERAMLVDESQFFPDTRNSNYSSKFPPQNNAPIHPIHPNHPDLHNQDALLQIHSQGNADLDQ